MVLTIDLKPEQAERLAAIAAREGRSVEDVAVDFVAESIEDDAWEQRWASEAVAEWESSDKQTRPAADVWPELGL